MSGQQPDPLSFEVVPPGRSAPDDARPPSGASVDPGGAGRAVVAGGHHGRVLDRVAGRSQARHGRTAPRPRGPARGDRARHRVLLPRLAAAHLLVRRGRRPARRLRRALAQRASPAALTAPERRRAAAAARAPRRPRRGARRGRGCGRLEGEPAVPDAARGERAAQRGDRTLGRCRARRGGGAGAGAGQRAARRPREIAPAARRDVFLLLGTLRSS